MVSPTNWIACLRRLRGLPRAVLAMLVLATAQTAILPCAMAAEMEHCIYCPPASHDTAQTECLYPDDPADVVGFATPQFAVSLLAMTTWCASPTCEQRHDIQNHAASDLAPPPARPLTLTHCVQLR